MMDICYLSLRIYCLRRNWLRYYNYVFFIASYLIWLFTCFYSSATDGFVCRIKQAYQCISLVLLFSVYNHINIILVDFPADFCLAEIKSKCIYCPRSISIIDENKIL